MVKLNNLAFIENAIGAGGYLGEKGNIPEDKTYCKEVKIFMNKSCFLALLFLVFGVCLQLKAQSSPDKPRVILDGRLLDVENKIPIPFAHITNQQLGLRSLSDSSGFFRLPVRSGDTLLISSVTYGQRKIVVPTHTKEVFVIELSPNVYELEEVVIQSLPSERKFKEMLLGMNSPEKEEKPDMRLPEELYSEPSDGTVGIGFGGAISGIAGKFSKKERGRRFAAEIKAKEEAKSVILSKFNRNVVQHITGLEDDEKLDAFMEYCVLSDAFLYKANSYEIHKAVLGCFDDFMKEQEG